MTKHFKLRLVAGSVTVGLTICLAEVACRFGGGEGVRLIRDPDHRLQKNTADTNSDGIRCAREASAFHAGDVNLIVVGDSYAYGYGVPRDVAFPEQLEQLCRARQPGRQVNVANFGWTSSSPYLELRLLKDIGRKYKPTAVIMCLDMTDFHDDIKYKHLIEKDRLIYKGAAIVPGLTLLFKKTVEKLHLTGLHQRLFDLPLDRFFGVNQPLSETRPFFDATLAAIQAANQYVTTELQARFVLVVLPRAFQYSARECPGNWEKEAYQVMGPYAREPFALFRELKPQLAYPCYSLLETFEKCGVFPTCQSDDPHWNQAGHRVAAQALYDIAVEQKLLPGGPAPRATAPAGQP
jgi:hypothetical protein